MAKVADELVIPVSKYPRWLALPVLIPRATLPPQSAIWSIIILISLYCISKGLEKRKAFFLSRSLDYAVSLLPCTSESKYRGRQHDLWSPPTPLPTHTHITTPSFACTSLACFIPPNSCLFSSFCVLLPHWQLHLMWNETLILKTQTCFWYLLK